MLQGETGFAIADIAYEQDLLAKCIETGWISSEGAAGMHAVKSAMSSSFPGPSVKDFESKLSARCQRRPV